jgi:hypothetical protein
MKQQYYHYTMWEDFQNGMYDEIKDGRRERVKQAAKLLSDTDLLYEQMTRVTHEWKYATEQNLTNASINHQAFLGQTACNIWRGIKEDETREAWGILTCEQRYKANKVADRVYKEWCQQYEREHETSYQLTLADLKVV